MDRINVRIEEHEKNYDIIIVSSILDNLKSYLRKKHDHKKVVIITDDNIKKLYQDEIKKIQCCLVISVKPGEDSKTRKIKQDIEDKILEKNLGRDTVIIAFGGGVIGDLSGFIASTYNRGVTFIQVPTSLLAMVDSSVGGKTGINTRHGKNLLGTIYQPDAVFTGINFLKTLSEEEFCNGISEIVKMSLILDKDLFNFIKDNHEKILSKDEKTLIHIIKRSIQLKKYVVERDEKEKGLRQILNFGHTIAHAIEAESKFKIKHGLAVSLGMIVESKISFIERNLSEKELDEIINLIRRLKLPYRLDRKVDKDKLLSLMKNDKKSVSSIPRFIILDNIGKVKSKDSVFSYKIEKETIKKAIDDIL